jgi:hypothetical protein
MSAPGAGYVFLAAVLARGLVGRCARALGDAGIPVMALKGVALHALVYDDAAERPLSDVDLLVPPERYEDALAALRATGFRAKTPSAPWATVLAHPEVPLDVDLHRALFPPGLFALDPGALFARARVDAATFGAEIHLPDDYDLYAHVIGHFAKSRMDARNDRAFVDLERIAAKRGLDPRRCAERLEAAGLGRAARYTLRARGEPDAFGRAVLEALPADAAGEALAALARAIARRAPQPSAWSAPASHLVNRTLTSGLRSLGAQALEAALRGRGRRR